MPREIIHTDRAPAAIGVAALPRGAQVEMDAVLVLDNR